MVLGMLALGACLKSPPPVPKAILIIHWTDSGATFSRAYESQEACSAAAKSVLQNYTVRGSSAAGAAAGSRVQAGTITRPVVLCIPA